MPSQSDFQSLVDWCSSPNPNARFRRVASAHLVLGYHHTTVGRWSGSLRWVEPTQLWALSRFEGGVLADDGSSCVQVTLGFVERGVEDTAVTGLHFIGALGFRSEEREVIQVDEWAGGALHVSHAGGGATLQLIMWPGVEVVPAQEP